jgi:DNA-binding HxlR family transcriptional regulator
MSSSLSRSDSNAQADADVSVPEGTRKRFVRLGVDQSDPLARALAVVGDRWSLAIIARLVEGPRRFNDLAETVAPIARTVLSERLRRLEETGLVSRRPGDTPKRHVYRLTLAGGELARVAGVLADWSSRHLGDGSPALVHRDCGGAILTAWQCENCGSVAPRDVASPDGN